MTKNFVDTAEWKIFSESQARTIINLTKEISQLKDKNKSLEKMLMDNSPLIANNGSQSVLFKELSDEEAIAVMELSKLKQTSLERELNDLECKRYDVYTKNLLSIREKKSKKDPKTVDQLTDAELLSIVKPQ